MSDQRLWAVRVILEGDETSVEEAQEAIARALCPDENHPGPCPTPWTMITVRLDELDQKEQREWQPLFDDERRATKKAGESEEE